MFIINTNNDLERLKNAPGWLPPSVKASVRKLFDRLREELDTEGLPDETFSVSPEGTIAILEPIDDLSVVFREAPSGVEYVELMDTHPTRAYRIGVMHDNDRMTQYIILACTLNAEDKAWLKQNVTEGGCGR